MKKIIVLVVTSLFLATPIAGYSSPPSSTKQVFAPDNSSARTQVPVGEPSADRKAKDTALETAPPPRPHVRTEKAIPVLPPVSTPLPATGGGAGAAAAGGGG